MENFINDYCDNYALSDAELERLSKYKINVVSYSDIKSLDDIFGDKNAAIVLYQTTDKYSGHWVLIMRYVYNGIHTIEYFDPYGDDIDNIITRKLHYNPKQKPIMYDILSQSDSDIIINNFKFQELSNNTQTCGRWCIVRFLLRMIPLTKFCALFKKKNYKLSRDNLTCLLTLLV